MAGDSGKRQLWEVVGGEGKGGIKVRKGHNLNELLADQRLQTGSLVAQRDLREGRLYYELVKGTGPRFGYVSIRTGGKDLLVKYREGAKRAEPAAMQQEGVQSPLASVQATGWSGSTTPGQAPKPPELESRSLVPGTSASAGSGGTVAEQKQQEAAGHSPAAEGPGADGGGGAAAVEEAVQQAVASQSPEAESAGTHGSGSSSPEEEPKQQEVMNQSVDTGSQGDGEDSQIVTRPGSATGSTTAEEEPEEQRAAKSDLAEECFGVGVADLSPAAGDPLLGTIRSLLPQPYWDYPPSRFEEHLRSFIHVKHEAAAAGRRADRSERTLVRLRWHQHWRRCHPGRHLRRRRRRPKPGAACDAEGQAALRQRNEELEATCAELQARVQHESSEAQGQIAELRGKNEELWGQVCWLAERVKELEGQLAAVEAARAELEAQAQSASLESQDRATQLAARGAELEAKCAEVEVRAQSEARSASGQIAQLKAKVVELEETCAELDEARAELEARDLELQIRQLTAKYEGLRTAHGNLEQAHERLKADKWALESRSRVVEGSVLELQRQLREARAAPPPCEQAQASSPAAPTPEPRQQRRDSRAAPGQAAGPPCDRTAAAADQDPPKEAEAELSGQPHLQEPAPGRRGAVKGFRASLQLRDAPARVTSVCIGRRLRCSGHVLVAAGGEDGVVALYWPARGEFEGEISVCGALPPARRLLGHCRSVTSICLDPSEDQLLTTSSDRSIRVWDAATGHAHHVFPSVGDAPLAVFLPARTDALVLARPAGMAPRPGGRAGAAGLQAISTGSGRVLRTWALGTEVSALCPDSGGRYILAGTACGRLLAVEAEVSASSDRPTLRSRLQTSVDDASVVDIALAPARQGPSAAAKSCWTRLLVTTATGFVAGVDCRYVAGRLAKIVKLWSVAVESTLRPLQCCYLRCHSGSGFLVSGSAFGPQSISASSKATPHLSSFSCRGQDIRRHVAMAAGLQGDLLACACADGVLTLCSSSRQGVAAARPSADSSAAPRDESGRDHAEEAPGQPLAAPPVPAECEGGGSRRNGELAEEDDSSEDDSDSEEEVLDMPRPEAEGGGVQEPGAPLGIDAAALTAAGAAEGSCDAFWEDDPAERTPPKPGATDDLKRTDSGIPNNVPVFDMADSSDSGSEAPSDEEESSDLATA